MGATKTKSGGKSTEGGGILARLREFVHAVRDRFGAHGPAISSYERSRRVQAATLAIRLPDRIGCGELYHGGLLRARRTHGPNDCERSRASAGPAVGLGQRLGRVDPAQGVHKTTKRPVTGHEIRAFFPVASERLFTCTNATPFHRSAPSPLEILPAAANGTVLTGHRFPFALQPHMSSVAHVSPHGVSRFVHDVLESGARQERWRIVETFQPRGQGLLHPLGRRPILRLSDLLESLFLDIREVQGHASVAKPSFFAWSGQ